MNNSNVKRQESVGVLTPQINQFDLSQSHLTTLDFFRLQPVYCKDMVEGDTFNVNVRALVDSAQFATKVYGSAHLDLHAFFVPNRVLYKDWDNYIYGDVEGQGNYTLPQVSLEALCRGCGVLPQVAPAPNKKENRRIVSSLGYPVQKFTSPTPLHDFPVSTLPLRAYQRIWWDFYRDSLNIQESDRPAYIFDNGGNDVSHLNTLITPRYRCFRKDYISTLLPQPALNGGSSADVKNMGWRDSATNNASLTGIGTSIGNITAPAIVGNTGTWNEWQQNVSISAIRAANAMQRYLERAGITGSRITERVMALFGQRISNERLDMAEFIGSKTIPLNISGLTNTGSNDPLSVVDDNAFGISDGVKTFGSIVSHGSGAGQSDTFHYHAVEHGFFIVIASIMPELVNPHNLDRMFIRGLATANRDRFDFLTPDMQGLGYQECLLSEIALPSYHDVSVNDAWLDSDPFQVVGYQPKYEDYRIGKNQISGDILEYDSRNSLPYLTFTRNLCQLFDPTDVVAGLSLTTPTVADRNNVDNHFSVTNSLFDHFIVNFQIYNDASRPLASNELPTELANLANSDLLDVSNGGVRL